ncbi:MAG: hypothetical protein KDH15_02415 [Rhodocyclaceae bacterium]|nr:hypothetical protein [Rhodocyclaceae bacterium]
MNMIEAPYRADANIHRLSLTPLLSLCEMQHDMLRLNVAAGVEFSRRLLEMMGDGVASPFPRAPVQVLGFYRDCVGLAFAPLTLMATASTAGPLAWQHGWPGL